MYHFIFYDFEKGENTNSITRKKNNKDKKQTFSPCCTLVVSKSLDPLQILQELHTYYRSHRHLRLMSANFKTSGRSAHTQQLKEKFSICRICIIITGGKKGEILTNYFT